MSDEVDWDGTRDILTKLGKGEKYQREALAVYKGEEVLSQIVGTPVFRTRAEAEAFYRLVLADPKIQRLKNKRGIKILRPVWVRREYASCDAQNGRTWLMLPYKFGLHQMTLLHEIAHLVTRGEHGREWCSLTLYLVRKYMGTVPAQVLRSAWLKAGAIKGKR